MNEALLGNLTTYIKFIVMTFAPAGIAGVADANTLIIIATMILGFAFACLDAKYPNVMAIFGNKPDQEEQIDVSEDGV